MHFSPGPAEASDRQTDRQTPGTQERSDRGLFAITDQTLVTQTYVCALSTSLLLVPPRHFHFHFHIPPAEPSSSPLALGTQSRAVLSFSRALQLSNDPGRTQATTASPPPTTPPLTEVQGLPTLQPGFLKPSPLTPPLSTSPPQGTGQPTQPRCPQPGQHPALRLLMLLVPHPFLH